MLGFFCSDCDETINAADDESTAQIIDRLDKHAMSCPLAQFTYDADTDESEQKMSGLREVIEGSRLASKIRLH